MAEIEVSIAVIVRWRRLESDEIWLNLEQMWSRGRGRKTELWGQYYEGT